LAMTTQSVHYFCAGCTRPLPKHKSKWCSPECREKHYHPGVDKVCIICSAPFVVNPSRKGTAHYCSHKCAYVNVKIKLRAGLAKIKQEKLDLIMQSECEICRSTHEIVLHFIDGEHANKHPTNLAILCLKCHHQIVKHARQVRHRLSYLRQVKSQPFYERYILPLIQDA